MRKAVAQVIDYDSILSHLEDRGYVVIGNVLSPRQVAAMRTAVDALFTTEREHPFDPDERNVSAEDAEIEAYLAESYPVSQAELDRLIRRIRHCRKINHNTPWPVPIKDVLKLFLHVPTLFDHDRSQRIWNLPTKGTIFAELIENPTVLRLVRSILGHDCVLSDCSATSVGPQTEGGAWHVDVPSRAALGAATGLRPDHPECLHAGRLYGRERSHSDRSGQPQDPQEAPLGKARR